MRRLTGKKRFLLAPLFILGAGAITYITMMLWNNLMPEIFHLAQISFWQAAGLLILSRLLLGSIIPHRQHDHHNNHNAFRERWESMKPEEREEFHKRMHDHRHWWTGSEKKSE